MTSTLVAFLVASTLSVLAFAATDLPPVRETPTVLIAQTQSEPGPVSPSGVTPTGNYDCQSALYSFGSFCDYTMQYAECFSVQTIQKCKKIVRECVFNHKDGRSGSLSSCLNTLTHSCSRLSHDRLSTDKILIENCNFVQTQCAGGTGLSIPTNEPVTVPYNNGRYYGSGSESSSDSSGGYSSTTYYESGSGTDNIGIPSSVYGGYGSSSSEPGTSPVTKSIPGGIVVPTSVYEGYGSSGEYSGSSSGMSSASGSGSGSFSGSRCFGIVSGFGSGSGGSSTSGSGSGFSGITDGSGRPDRSGEPDGDRSRSGRPNGDRSRSDRPTGDRSRSDRPDGDRSRSGRPSNVSGPGLPDGKRSFNDSSSTTAQPTISTFIPITNILVNIEDLTEKQKENIIKITLTGFKEEQFLRMGITFFREEIFKLVNMHLLKKGNNRQKRQQAPLSPNDVFIVQPLVEVKGGLQIAFVVGGREGQSTLISGDDMMSLLESQGQQLAEELSKETGLLVEFSGVLQDTVIATTAESSSPTTSEQSTDTPLLVDHRFQGLQQLSVGAIIGIVVGLLLLIVLLSALLIIIGVLSYRAVKRRRKSETLSTIMAKNYVTEQTDKKDSGSDLGGTWQPMSVRNEYISVAVSDKEDGIYSV